MLNKFDCTRYYDSSECEYSVKCRTNVKYIKTPYAQTFDDVIHKELSKDNTKVVYKNTVFKTQYAYNINYVDTYVGYYYSIDDKYYICDNQIVINLLCTCASLYNKSLYFHFSDNTLLQLYETLESEVTKYLNYNTVIYLPNPYYFIEHLKFKLCPNNNNNNYL